MKKALVMFLAGIFLLAGVEAGAAEVADMLKEVEINGFVSAGYTYNFNEPFSRTVNFRPFNNRHDSISLEAAELVFHKDASAAGEAGFRLDAYFGYTVPQAIRSTGHTGSDDFDIKQAYVSYVVPVGSGLKLDAGKFITEMGYEVIEGYDGWNDNYSRSLLFYYTIPFTHTGLRAGYSFNDAFSLVAAVVNGWDNVVDNNGGKTVMLHGAVTPVENTTLNLKYCFGPEQDDNNNDLRHVFNLNLSTSVRDLSIGIDYVYGKEKNVPGFGDSTWSGVAGVFRYPLTERLALNARAEVLKDSKGARTGTEQKMREFTITPEYTVSKNMLVRAEYRRDSSDQPVFDKKDTTSSKHQDTVGVNVIYHF